MMTNCSGVWITVYFISVEKCIKNYGISLSKRQGGNELRVLITGGSGFIGTNLVDAYVSAGCTVCNLDCVAPRNLKQKQYWKKVDLMDKQVLEEVLKDFKPELVFHLAARTDLNGTCLSDYSANLEGVENIILAIEKTPSIKYVVFASSMLVCRLGYQPKSDVDYCPDTLYGNSKMLGEKIIRSSTLRVPWTIVRPTSIWGPWFDVPYKSFFDIVRKGLYLHPSGYRVKRSYGFVYNAVFQLRNIAQMTDKSLVGKTTYLADYSAIELKSWATMIQKKFNVNIIRELPYWVFKVAAFCGDFAKWSGLSNPPMSSSRLRNMLTDAIYNTDILEAYCGTVPYSAKQGVEITCNWIVENTENK
jgi:nucleoside-diphosphate-sugar epimerase